MIGMNKYAAPYIWSYSQSSILNRKWSVLQEVYHLIRLNETTVQRIALL